MAEHVSVRASLRRAEQAAALASSKAGASQQELESQVANLQQRLHQVGTRPAPGNTTHHA